MLAQPWLAPFRVSSSAIAPASFIFFTKDSACWIETSLSWSPCIIKDGADCLLMWVIGEIAAPIFLLSMMSSTGSNCFFCWLKTTKSKGATMFGIAWGPLPNCSFPSSPQLRKSVGGKKQATALAPLANPWTWSFEFNSPPFFPATPIINERCPPAEPPEIPIFSGSISYSFAFDLMNLVARWRSSIASGIVNFGWLPCTTANTW